MQASELDGLKKGFASQLFNIRRNPINLWFQRQAETGDVMALPRQSSSKGHQITIGRSFAHLQTNMALKLTVSPFHLWEGDISDRTPIASVAQDWSDAKKNRMGIGNGMKRNAPDS